MVSGNDTPPYPKVMHKPHLAFSWPVHNLKRKIKKHPFVLMILYHKLRFEKELKSQNHKINKQTNQSISQQVLPL